VGAWVGSEDGKELDEGSSLNHSVGTWLGLRDTFRIGAWVGPVCVSGTLVRRSRAEGVLLRAVGAGLGLCDIDGCMLGLEFGSITFKDRLKALWSNPGSVHDAMSNDSIFAKESLSSSAVPIFVPL
jgi:hypothetical protein